MAGIAADLYETIERTVEGLGYELVDVERLAAGLLRVTLDAPQGVRLEDCERVSRQLSQSRTSITTASRCPRRGSTGR
jgi:ribosome maturation factor RimP